MKFMTISVGGQKWEQHMVRPKHPVFEGDSCHGLTDPARCRVYFSRGSPQPQFESTFVHENFGHVAFYVSGVSQMILKAFDGDQDAAESFEEEAITKLETVWYPMLQHFEFKFPKVEK